MVCGFCPGSGSAAERSFNRADIFKQHLASVHGVQHPWPNDRKRSLLNVPPQEVLDISHNLPNRCSICSIKFSNVQEFYEHLDDCVLRTVQHTGPGEAINGPHLSRKPAPGDKLDREFLERSQIAADLHPPLALPQQQFGEIADELRVRKEPTHSFPSLRADQLPTPSSYWSVSEQARFENIFSTFGTNWSALANAMKTKTPSMVRKAQGLMYQNTLSQGINRFLRSRTITFTS